MIASDTFDDMDGSPVVIAQPATVARPQTAAGGVCWAAIFAGATAAAALSLILLILGVGLGLSSVSPWAQEGISGKAFGLSTIAWLTFTQLAAAGMGGYLAGRLRRQWLDTHVDEVYFRDTAHGFLAWGLATLATAALLTSAVGSIVSAGVNAGAALAGGGAKLAASAVVGAAAASQPTGKSPPSATDAMSYSVDRLFRGRAAGDSAPSDAQEAAEASRILVQAVGAGVLPPDDAAYLGQLVAQRTGLSQPEAERRVTEAFAKLQASTQAAEDTARKAADEARKASMVAALWFFISLLIGAFAASLAATWGGRQRDAVVLVRN